MKADDSKGIGVIIPEKYNDDELSAALTLIAYLENYESVYDTYITLITDKDAHIDEYDSLIYLGNYEKIPDFLSSLVENKKEDDNSSVYLFRKSLNKYRTPVLLIISNDGNQLMAGVKALKNDDLRTQMITSEIELPKKLDVKIKEKVLGNYSYFSDLGINGLEVSGRNPITNIGFQIPYNKILSDESNISLNFRYSDNLDFEKSMISVYINGVPIGSHKLEREKRDLDNAIFYIPKDLRANRYWK